MVVLLNKKKYWRAVARSAGSECIHPMHSEPAENRLKNRYGGKECQGASVDQNDWKSHRSLIAN